MSVVFYFIAFVFESLENLVYVELFHLSSWLLGREREPWLRGLFARKIWLWIQVRMSGLPLLHQSREPLFRSFLRSINRSPTAKAQAEALRYQLPFRTVHARIAVALVVFIKTPINHIFFKILIIPDYGFELTKTSYLNAFQNWNALCKITRLYKSCSTPAGNKRKKTINTAFASQHVSLKNRVSDFWQVRLFFFY